MMFTLVSLYVFFILYVVRAAPVSSSTNGDTPNSTTRNSQWFTVEWDNVAFSRISGTLVVPDVQGSKSGIFVWPGLQGDSSIALQAVLSSSSSQAQAILQGAAIDLTKSDPIPAPIGDTLDFDIFQINLLSNTWAVTIAGQDVTMQTFSLPSDVSFNRAVFAVQASNPSHDFTVSFHNLVLTSASSPAATWCSEIGSNGYDASNSKYIVAGATALGTECFIQELVLPGTA